MPGIGQNLQPFTGHGDVSILVKNSRVGRPSPTPQPPNSWVSPFVSFTLYSGYRLGPEAYIFCGSTLDHENYYVFNAS